MDTKDETIVLSGFDAYMEKSLKDWNCPGAAVCIVKDDRVVYSRGFGMRDVANHRAVDADTVFAIGSSSKAFTTACLAILVDRGLLEWDRPIKDYIPSFKMWDPFATERMTARDLVCHRSGLPRHDLMWYGSPFTREQIFERLAGLKPSKDFRTYFQYQNLMFMAAGYLVEKLTGMTWEAFVEKEILGALDMKRSNTSVEKSKLIDNHSMPYRNPTETPEEIPFRNIDSIGPAGSINSSVNDMAHWLIMHINGGSYCGKRIVSEANLAECHKSTTPIASPFFRDMARFDELGEASYGLGWFMQTYRGHKMIHHGGHIDGFSSLVSFLPKEKVGVVVLCNIDGSSYNYAPTLNVYDRFLGLDELPWSERLLSEAARLKAADEDGRKASSAERISGTSPAHPLAAYTGDYAHASYGQFKVECVENALRVLYNGIKFKGEHYHYETFDFVSEDGDHRFKVSFVTNTKGAVSSLTVGLEPNVDSIEFTRQPDAKLSDPRFLALLAGSYDLQGQKVSVSLHGENSLAVALPGQSEMELEPYQGVEFKVKGAPFVWVAFQLDGEKVKQVDINQMGAVFSALRVS